ncbi:hypothetical protein ASD04_11275 [Devosia sp. Root436]|uniref:hypothetical protein n=1 Tax=Devosia sp. Root436 TaxID=1736537 RepID=UPI0006F4153B|nr:hypothetical protein [Devosia sp. Root436]KQX38194.1 hypothetical protein ASD04_11275 [Devosia sp. Root436]
MSYDHTDHGKWSETGVPKKGWNCVGVDDLGEPSQTCEMCGTAEIRYVHIMHHPDYPADLSVGCICAENMEQDYVRPREREKRLRTLAARRKTWRRRQWKVSGRGNWYLNTEGYNLVIVPSGRKWRVVVSNRATGASQTGRTEFSLESEAQVAALTALVWAKDHLPS